MPSVAMRTYKGPADTLDEMAKNILGPNGERSIEVRRFTEWVIGEVTAKDYLGEILTLRNMLVQPSPFRPGVPLIRFTNDPSHVEFLRTPERMVKDIIANGTVACDCDEYTCLAAAMLLAIGRGVELVAMGFAPGSLSHVALRAREPKTGQWILVDGVAGPRERDAASKAVELMVRSLE